MIAERARREIDKAPPHPRPLYWECFWDIADMRQQGAMALASVPGDKLYWYAEHELGLDDEDQRAFVWVMKRADRHFVAKMNERSSKAASTPQKR